MIYFCWNCGWRIAERHKVANPADIGKYLLYEHKPFCSQYCINCYKHKPKARTAPVDWDWPFWKITRKEPKKLRIKMAKLLATWLIHKPNDINLTLWQTVCNFSGVRLTPSQYMMPGLKGKFFPDFVP